MKVCFLGDFSGNPDEGMKNISSNIVSRVSIRNEVVVLSPRDCLRPKKLKQVRKFSPDIIHYLHGPSIRSFLIIRFLGLLLPNSKTVMSITNPRIDKFWLKAIPFLRPWLVFTQSKGVDVALKKIGFKTCFFPNGVDINKFKPMEHKSKVGLRIKYNIDRNKFVILHVGHIRENRNLEVFCEIQNKINNVQVIIIGSTHFKKDTNIEKKLRASGCLVWQSYFDNIEEIYNLSDCYVFPVNAMWRRNPLNKLTGCIEIPLSVLEAMACNLPVVSTRYGGLADLFVEGDGLYFYENHEILDKIRIIMNGVEVRNREKVIPYSWERLIQRLEKIYKELPK